MKYTKKQFLADVLHEATQLRKLATKEEKEQLDFDLLRPNYGSDCIYGQMTGGCRTPRAITLIQKCCIRFVENEFANNKWDNIREYINGAKVKRSELVHGTLIPIFSAIETYIMMPEAKNKRLIAFIKGEIDTVKL